MSTEMLDLSIATQLPIVLSTTHVVAPRALPGLTSSCSLSFSRAHDQACLFFYTESRVSCLSCLSTQKCDTISESVKPAYQIRAMRWAGASQRATHGSGARARVSEPSPPRRCQIPRSPEPQSRSFVYLFFVVYLFTIACGFLETGYSGTYILGRPESCWLPVMQNKFNSLDTAATTNFAYRDGNTISPKHLRAGRIEHRYHSGVIEMSITVEENKEGRIILPPWPEDALARAEVIIYRMFTDQGSVIRRSLIQSIIATSRFARSGRVDTRKWSQVIIHVINHIK